MDADVRIRSAQERAMAVFERKPQAALSSVRATGRVAEGLRCTVRQGHLEARMDMPEGLGGEHSAPTPGFFFRAALAGCVAIGIKMTATRESIPVESIDVDVEMDFDDSALFGMGSNSAAPLETRLLITIQSPRPDSEVSAMIDRALAADTFYLALRDAQKVSTRISVGGA